MTSLKRDVVLPGCWLGVFGGGQLGRMFVHAAQRLGYHVAVLDPEQNCPASQAADRHFAPKNAAEAKIMAEEMARLCSVITLEFENVDVDLVRLAARVTRVAPGPDFLETCQDRVTEKSRLSQSGFPTTPFVHVNCSNEANEAGEELGWPIVLKTARSGYDGKGQVVVRSAEQLHQAWDSLKTNRAVAEKMIDFEAEVSVIAARNAAGQVAAFPMFENEHANHILDVTRCPVSASLKDVEESGLQICCDIADTFSVVGLFCVEFFVTRDGGLMINEMAPRPHNSGHLTMEAFAVSQFEQQVRAICNLPLSSCESGRPAAMVNLLGDVWESGDPNWAQAFQRGDTHLHLYGKAQPRPARKMCHITVLDETSSEAAITAKEVRDELQEPTAEE